MPIYAYRCAACGHAKDVLQKLADPTLTDCPACGKPRFEKQVTAAGFQLKGSGWYATDFRNGQAPKADGKAQETTAPAPAAPAATSAAAAPASAPAAASPPASTS
jgi:putative FmdB family regulatory protein